MEKITSGIKTAKKGATPIYKTVFVTIMIGLAVGLVGLVGTITGILTSNEGDKLQALANFLNATALAILTYNAKVNIKANRLAVVTGILAVFVAGLGFFSLLK